MKWRFNLLMKKIRRNLESPFHHFHAILVGPFEWRPENVPTSPVLVGFVLFATRELRVVRPTDRLSPTATKMLFGRRAKSPPREGRQNGWLWPARLDDLVVHVSPRVNFSMEPLKKGLWIINDQLVQSSSFSLFIAFTVGVDDPWGSIVQQRRGDRWKHLNLLLFIYFSLECLFHFNFFSV